MALDKDKSQMADSAGNPLIGEAQPAMTAASAVTGLANNADVATLVALKTELDATNTRVAELEAIVEAHGLAKSN